MRPLPDARRDAGLMRQLGAACAALDRNGEARAWYKLAIDLDPLDAESQQALFRLNDPSQNNPQVVPPHADPRELPAARELLTYVRPRLTLREQGLDLDGDDGSIPPQQLLCLDGALALARVGRSREFRP